MSTRVPLILGAGQMGAPNTGERISDPAIAQEFADLMARHGHVGIDTSRIYCKGTSEELLGTLALGDAPRIDTKVYPVQPGDHAPAKLKTSFRASVAALKSKKIRVFYLHRPDRSVPFEDTLSAVDELYREGGFAEFGLSNYTAWEVAEIAGICTRRAFVRPTVYQGVYNLLDRMTEAELFPCLRKHGLRFAAYTPLAGGFLTERFVPDPAAAAVTDGALTKFAADSQGAWFYTGRYLPAAGAVAVLRAAAHAHGLTLTEVALRWLQWHSALAPGDAVIVAASRRAQLEGTLADSAKGALPDEVVAACEEAWKEARGGITQYWL
ncbi:aldo/keto reductase [Phanerochaete sordida]|uniref:Aldo/keto reductase n=1 Tax=Phanerochaete sordida TaxID=48140 RepID=A0A9P3LEV4_9APHY|nr:aldo/keto reductase [Phanerochaete sordida]